MSRRIVAGATSQLIEFPVYDSSSTTGELLAGLVYNANSLTAYYNIQGATGSAVAISLVGMTKGTWTSGGFVAVDEVNMPGVYQVGIPNLALAATVGVKYVTVVLKGAANMTPVFLEIELQQVVDMNVNVSSIALNAINAAAINVDTGLKVATGTATAGAASTLTLASDPGGTAVDNTCRGEILVLTGGLGAGQARVISGYVSSTKVATVIPAWTTTPNNTSTYTIVPQGRATVDQWVSAVVSALVSGRVDSSVGAMAANVVSAAAIANAAIDRATFAVDTGLLTIRSGTAVGVGASTITLDASAKAVDNFYRGTQVVITGGTNGVGQKRTIVSYVGSTKVATLDMAWDELPTGTITFAIPAWCDGGIDFTSQEIASITTAASNSTPSVTVSNKTGFSLANASIAAATFGANAIDSNAMAQSAADKVWVSAARSLTDKAGFTLTAGEEADIATAVAAAILLTPANKIAVDASNQVVASSVQGNVAGSVASVIGAVGSVTTRVTANADRLNGSATAAANAALQFDGTGIVGDTFPARQDQLTNLVSTGAATNQFAESWVNLSAPVATTETGGVANTVARDTTYDVLTNTSQAADSYYEFDVGGKGIPTGVSIYMAVQNVSKSVAVYGYVWGSLSWVQIGTVSGTAGLALAQQNFAMYTSMVGSGANLGKVRIRFLASASSTTITVDQLYVSYASVNNSVGYAQGAIWIDSTHGSAGAVPYINGVADKPVTTWADALSLSVLMNIYRFNIAPATLITATADCKRYAFEGRGWQLALGGFDFSYSAIVGCEFVTGVATAADWEMFFWECHMGACTLGEADLHNCHINDTITLGSIAPMLFQNCVGVPAGTPGVNFASAIGASKVIMGNTSGVFTIFNMKAGDILYVDGNCDLIIDSTCTAGTVYINGNIRLTNNGSGQTITDTSRYGEDQNMANVTGTVATVTNLTNAPTNGDLTATMKASVTAAVPTVVQIRTEMDSSSTKLANLDAAVSSRLASASYTAPPSVGAIDTQLSGTHGAGAWGGGSGLSAQQVRDAMALSTLATPSGNSIDSQLSGIDSKTTNLPANPASQTNLDVAVSTRAAAATAVSNADLTPTRAAKLDSLDATVSSRLASAGYTTPPTVVQVRTEMDANSTKLANLDATVSSRLASASYTAPNNADVVLIKAQTDKLDFDASNNVKSVKNATDLGTADFNATEKASIAAAVPTTVQIRTEMDANSNKLDATVSSRLAAATYTAPDNSGIATIQTQTDKLNFDTSNNVKSVKNATDLGTADFNATEKASITAAVPTVVQIRSEMDSNSTKLANLDATTSSRAAASTAVSNVDITPARAAKLDNIDAAVSSRLASASYAAPPSAGDIDIALGVSHGFGAWDGLVPAQVIRDAMKLAPSAGAPAVGSIDEIVSDISLNTDPVAMASAVWNAAVIGYTYPGTFGLSVGSIMYAVDSIDSGIYSIDSDIQTLVNRLGAPYGISGGSATIADNIKAIADYTGGTTFDSGLHSMRAIKEALPNFGGHRPVFINGNGDIEEMP